MTIETYADDLFNRYSVNQQYNHGDLYITELKIRVLKEVCEELRREQPNESQLLKVINGCNELLE